MPTIQKELKELTDEILAVTMGLRDKYPEVYKLLGETPFLTSGDNNGIDPSSTEEYLNTIRSQLKHCKKKCRVQFLPGLKQTAFQNDLLPCV